MRSASPLLVSAFLLGVVFPASAQPQGAPMRSGGTLAVPGNIWFSDGAERVEAKIADLEALGMDGFRLAGRLSTFLARGRQPQILERILRQAEEAGMRVVIHPHEYAADTLAALPLDAFRRGGAALGRVAARYPETVAGFVIGNEHDIPLGRVRDPEGRAALFAAVGEAFAEGVHSAFPGVPISTAGIAFPGRRTATQMLRAYARPFEEGDFNVVGVHFYSDRRECSRAARSGSFGMMNQVDRLLSSAGYPRNTPLYVGEAGVDRTTMRSDQEAAECLGRLLRELDADPRVIWIGPYSPWPGNPGVTAEHEIRPGSPEGDAVRAWARGSSVRPAPRPEPSRSEPEAPWYCRWFGLGCQ